MTTPKLEQRHFEALELLRQAHYVGECPPLSFDEEQALDELPAILRDIRADNLMLHQALQAANSLSERDEHEMAKLVAENERLREWLSAIRQYGSDTLSGRTDGPDDRKWQRESVLEMTKRSRLALEGEPASPPQAPAVPDALSALDKGPWTILAPGKSLNSEDFTYDARINIDGDFGDPEIRGRYLIALRDRLNGAAPAPQQAAVPAAEPVAWRFRPRREAKWFYNSIRQIPICGGPVMGEGDWVIEPLYAAPQPAAVPWDLFPGWLLDHHEGDVITEESLQFWLSEMLSAYKKDKSEPHLYTSSPDHGEEE